MEDYVTLYEKQYPREAPNTLYTLLGFPTEYNTPEELPDVLPVHTGEDCADAQDFSKLAVWISQRWHINISVTQYRDYIAVEYTFPEHCTFFTPYLSEMKELFQRADTANIVPNYEKQILQMVFVYEYTPKTI